jgi:hypothetical protein
LFEVFELVLAEAFGPLQNLRCDIVAINVKHDLFVHFALLGGVFHENDAHFFKLFLRHRLHGLLHHSRTVLLLAKLAKVQPDELVEATDSHIHLLFAFGDRYEVIQNSLDHEVTELIIDQHFDTLRRDTD